MKYNIKNIVKHTSMYSVGSIASKAIGFFLIPLYTHFLSPEDYGVLELLTMMVILTGIIIQGGIATAVFKFFNNYESDKDKKQIISTLLISVSSFCFWICILLSLFSKNISILLFTHNQFDSFVILMLISFFFSTVSSVPETYLLAKKESKKFTIITLVTLAVNLSLNIYFVAFVKAGIVGILYSSIISRFLNTSYLLFLTIPQIRLNFDLKILKSILKFSIPLIPAEIGLFIFAFSDRFFLSHMSNLENVGLYSLGYRFAFMISLLIIQPFMQIWQQEMYEICDKEGAKEIFGRIYTYLFGIVAGAALIMSIFIKDVIEIISAPEFHEAWKVVPVIAFALVFRATYQYFQMGMLFKSKAV